MSWLPSLLPRSRRMCEIAPMGEVFAALDATMARIEFSPDGTIVTANDQFLDLVGYTLDEVRGKNHAMFVDEPMRGSVAYREFWERLRAGVFQAGEFHRLGRGGRSLWIQATYSPVTGPGGRVRGVVKFAFDVTERVRLREADREIQQRFTQMVENTTVRLILADRDLRIVYMNPASIESLHKLQRLLPCPVDAIMGQSIDIFHKRPEYQRGIVMDPRNLPHRAEIALGDEVLDLSVSALRDRDGNYMGPLVTWEVVTEKVRATRQLRSLAGQISEAADQQTERAGEAAKEIAVLIKESTKRVQEGAALSEKVGGSLRAIIEAVGSTERGIAAIASSTEQQAANAHEVKLAIRSVSQTTENSASSAEEMAASAEQLNAQAQGLRDLVRQFQV